MAGREVIWGFLTSIFSFIKGIEIKQHIADGDYVATVFDMETISGVDRVVSCLLRATDAIPYRSHNLFIPLVS